jgi:nucleotide-binding universal stress UspA family protein
MKNDAPGIDKMLLIRHHRRPSSKILGAAVDLARRCGARLTFADVLEGGDQIDELFQRERLRELESWLSPHLEGLDVDYQLMNGDLAAATSKVQGQFDLVFLVENERASEASRHEVRRVLRRSSLPVWIDSGAGRAPRRILAAVDVMTRDPVKRGLNLPILERALLLASVYRAELDILSVWMPPASTLALAHRLAGTSDRLVRRGGKARQRLEELVEQARRLAPALEQEPRLLIAGGIPAEMIAQTTDATRTDLLIAGCVGRDGLAAWLVGDTAEKLSRRLDCSILAVKPTPDVLVEGASVGDRQAA